jgi:hypothetical protein
MWRKLTGKAGEFESWMNLYRFFFRFIHHCPSVDALNDRSFPDIGARRWTYRIQ